MNYEGRIPTFFDLNMHEQSNSLSLSMFSTITLIYFNFFLTCSQCTLFKISGDKTKVTNFIGADDFTKYIQCSSLF